MYMREMGTVELLTREGEIEIAKRIEGGLMAMMEAISASPATIAEILRLAERHPRRQDRHLHRGRRLLQPERGRRLRGRGRLRRVRRRRRRRRQGRLQGADQEARRAQERSAGRFDSMRSCSRRSTRSTTRKATARRPTSKAQQALSDELMTIRFTAKTIEKLCDMVRGQVDDVRKKSASCAASSSTSAACRRKTSSRTSRPTC